MSSMNKPSSWEHGMTESLANPKYHIEGILAAGLTRDGTMNEWGTKMRWRMGRTEGKRERQCLIRCYEGKGNWLGCSGQTH